MPQSRSTRGTVVPVSGQLSPAGRLGRFLRRRHPVKTAIAVEAECGVSEEAIKKLFSRGSLPGFVNLGRLIAAYGPELLAEMMDDPPEWLVRAAAADGAADGPNDATEA